MIERTKWVLIQGAGVLLATLSTCATESNRSGEESAAGAHSTGAAPTPSTVGGNLQTNTGGRNAGGAHNEGGGYAGAGAAADDGGELPPARVKQIQNCMKARWGDAPTRDAFDVVDDLVACSTEDERDDYPIDQLFDLVTAGWAEFDPDDPSVLHRLP